MLGSRLQGLDVMISRVKPGWTLLGAHPLAGGVSAGATRLELIGPAGALERLVLRRTPDPAAEQAVLARLAAAGLPAPAPVWGGVVAGVPCSLVGWLDGRALAAHDLPALAETLAALHALRPALVHGDVWPGNALVRPDGRVALLDWEDAAAGPPAQDVANARLELTWAFGAAAADAFLAAYRAAAPHEPLTDLAAWEAAACDRLGPKLAGFGLAPAEEARMRAQLAAFRQRA